jgi:hypothetical protein
LGVWLKLQYGAIIEANANQLLHQCIIFLTQFLRAISYKNLVPCVNILPPPSRLEYYSLFTRWGTNFCVRVLQTPFGVMWPPGRCHPSWAMFLDEDSRPLKECSIVLPQLDEIIWLEFGGCPLPSLTIVGSGCSQLTLVTRTAAVIIVGRFDTWKVCCIDISIVNWR